MHFKSFLLSCNQYVINVLSRVSYESISNDTRSMMKVEHYLNLNGKLPEFTSGCIGARIERVLVLSYCFIFVLSIYCLYLPLCIYCILYLFLYQFPRSCWTEDQNRLQYNEQTRYNILDELDTIYWTIQIQYIGQTRYNILDEPDIIYWTNQIQYNRRIRYNILDEPDTI